MHSRHLWGIDLGGTKIEGAIVNPARPDEAVHRLRRDTGAALGYGHVLSQIISVVRELESVSGEKCPGRLGIGTPGAVEPSTGALKNSNTTCLIGRPLQTDLSNSLGCEIRTANDANCFALAEATLGAARGEGVVFGIILGTGVGGGMVVDGRVLNGCQGIAGEWGHNPICGEDRPCYCGRKGCVEAVISGPALEAYYNGLGGERLRLPKIAERAAGGEEAGVRTLERLRVKFGEALAAVLNIVDPDAVVIGGGVGNLDLLYEDGTREAIRAHLFNPELRTKILRPMLGDSAGVFGAAMLTAEK
jgi:predicted NBD/HSP70 family sugar kinase